MTTTDLHHQKRTALAQARAIVERAHEEHRADLRPEEEAAYQRATAEIRRIDDEINAENRARELAASREILESLEGPVLPGYGGLRADQIEPFLRTRGAGSLDVTFAGLRVRSVGGELRVEQRDIYGYTTQGTLTVQNPVVASRLYEVLLDQGAIWRLGPEIVQTSTGNPVSWPKMTAVGTATVTSEGTALVEADPTLGTITTTPVKYAKLTQLSSEIVHDSSVDLVGFVARDMGYAMAKQYGTHMAVGTGSGQPEGYMTASVGVSAAGTCSAESAIRLSMAVNQQYRARGKYATNSGVLSYWRTLRADSGGTTGPWLLNPPGSPGEAETLFGRPVIEDPNITAHGSAVKSVAYGDFMNGYLVHDAGFRFERSDDYAFANDLVSWRGIWRLDGRIRDTNAIKVYQATAN